MPDNVTLDPPTTNIERLLANAAGMEGVSADEAETRIERYLKAICDRLDNGVVLVVTDTDGTLDKTAKEIKERFLTTGCVIINGTEMKIVSTLNYSDGDYTVYAGSYEYWTDDENGYPQHE